MPGFHHTDLLPLGPDETEYRRLSLPPGTAVEAAGRTFLEIDPATLTALVREAVNDIQHLLRPAHLAQLRAIVDDPEASSNDRFVATDLLRNACVSASTRRVRWDAESPVSSASGWCTRAASRSRTPASHATSGNAP